MDTDAPPPLGGSVPVPAGGTRESLLSRARRFVFGDDVFISYSRADASDYALALADALTREGISCFVDQFGTTPKHELPDDLKSVLRASGALVVVASPAAARSRWVGEEIALFRTLRRPILPVSIDRAELDAVWKDEVVGLAITLDTAEELRLGQPGGDVVRRIAAALEFRKRSRRLRRVFRATVAATAAVVLVAGAWLTLASRRIARQQTTAESIQLANRASARMGTDPEAGLHLALRAAALDDNFPSRFTLLSALRGNPRLAGLLRHGGSWITGVALSPDGHLLAASGDEGLRVWNLRTRRPVAVPGGRDTVGTTAVTFSPDGQWLIAADSQGLVVRRAADLATITALPGPAASSSIAVSRDGFVAAGTADGTGLWRLDAQGRPQPAGSPLPPGLSLAFSPGGGTLAIGSRASIHLVDPSRARVIRSIPLEGTIGPIAKVGFSADGETLAAIDSSAQAILWSTATWDRLYSGAPAGAQPGEGESFAFEGTAMFTAGVRGQIHRWAAAGPGPDFTAEVVGTYPDVVTALAVSGDGALLVSAHADGSVALWTMRGVPGLERPLWTNAHVEVAAFDSSGRILATNGPDGFHLRDTESWQAVRLAGWLANATALAPNGTVAAAARQDTLYLWDRQGQRWVVRPAVFTGLGTIADMRFSPDGSMLTLWDYDVTRLCRLDVTRQGAAPRCQPGPPWVLAIARDNRLLAVRDGTFQLYLYDLDKPDSPARSLGSAGHSVLAAAFVDGGRRLLTYNDGGELVRWSNLRGKAPTGEVEDTVFGNTGGARQRHVWLADMSSDGRYLAVAFEDDEPAVWDLEERAMLLVPSGARAAMGILVLNADGSRLARVSKEGQDGRYYDLSPRAGTRRACSILGIPMHAGDGGRDPVRKACRASVVPSGDAPKSR